MPNPFLRDIQVFMLGVRFGVVGILAREDVKVLTVYVDLSVICVDCVDCVICVGYSKQNHHYC
jgi:hypothetical protein